MQKYTSNTSIQICMITKIKIILFSVRRAYILGGWALIWNNEQTILIKNTKCREIFAFDQIEVSCETWSEN